MKFQYIPHSNIYLLINYLNKIVNYRATIPNKFVKYIDYSYFSYNYYKIITNRIKLDPSKYFEFELPYKDISENDPDFINENEKYSYNDVIHLKYYIADDTKVKLF